jgi:hypothetical protein
MDVLAEFVVSVIVVSSSSFIAVSLGRFSGHVFDGVSGAAKTA